MNFDFSDELKLLGEQARRFLGERCTTAAVRAHNRGPLVFGCRAAKFIASCCRLVLD
jgi:hypothetical protein